MMVYRDRAGVVLHYARVTDEANHRNFREHRLTVCHVNGTTQPLGYGMVYHKLLRFFDRFNWRRIL